MLLLVRCKVDAKLVQLRPHSIMRDLVVHIRAQILVGNESRVIGRSRNVTGLIRNALTAGLTFAENLVKRLAYSGF
jgi:hypothetical protein